MPMGEGNGKGGELVSTNQTDDILEFLLDVSVD